MTAPRLLGASFTLNPVAVSISDVTVTEGNCGQKNATFTVTLARSAGTVILVANYATGGGTAAADGTPRQSMGALTFGPGAVSQPVTVPILGDTTFRSAETFNVTLNAPVNATLADAVGAGTYTNDDRELLPGEEVVASGERGRGGCLRIGPHEDGGEQVGQRGCLLDPGYRLRRWLCRVRPCPPHLGTSSSASAKATPTRTGRTSTSPSTRAIPATSRSTRRASTAAPSAPGHRATPAGGHQG